MPPQEQADLWMALRDRMKVDWHELTMQEKKAGMFQCSREAIAPGTALRAKCGAPLAALARTILSGDSVRDVAAEPTDAHRSTIQNPSSSSSIMS